MFATLVLAAAIGSSDWDLLGDDQPAVAQSFDPWDLLGQPAEPPKVVAASTPRQLPWDVLGDSIKSARGEKSEECSCGGTCTCENCPADCLKEATYEVACAKAVDQEKKGEAYAGVLVASSCSKAQLNKLNRLARRTGLQMAIVPASADFPAGVHEVFVENGKLLRRVAVVTQYGRKVCGPEGCAFLTDDLAKPPEKQPTKAPAKPAAKAEPKMEDGVLMAPAEDCPSCQVRTRTFNSNSGWSSSGSCSSGSCGSTSMKVKGGGFHPFRKK